MTQMNELGFYTLAGAPESPRELIDSRATGIEPGCPPRRADRAGIEPVALHATGIEVWC